ncbi:MAG: hypothetical protein GTO51_06560 [Candidatus Latescibacteria bacterium]|nr:hypothetical protein [Candidatus Latescibacterota bacterium]NIM21464.1 hypothetical protein [Candidatus Latescibacterota bacterium]NIM65635.1 hypothetical protein [Candidatus Latescibacterota bacterium]NIO02017.1 hypothetical protein [Candidatus Latescibacterota bacterium]NIO28829.1 hypothetical protein [Candidatus Latescibacterota bacterium]
MVERINDRYCGGTLAAQYALNQLTGVNYYDSYEGWKEWYKKEYGTEYVGRYR